MRIDPARFPRFGLTFKEEQILNQKITDDTRAKWHKRLDDAVTVVPSGDTRGMAALTIEELLGKPYAG